MGMRKSWPPKVDEKQHLAVLRQLAQLQEMTIAELREKWTDLNGTEPPTYKKQFMVRRLAYRIQEIFYGGLSKETKTFLERVAKDDPLATLEQTIPETRTANKKILPGTKFVRIYEGKRYEVVAQEKGFLYDNTYYRSLSGVAKAITGSKWNGRVFFGLRKYQGYEEHYGQ